MGVLGAGAWGTTLANLLAENGAEVTLWSHSGELAERLARERRNTKYLPGVQLHPGVQPTGELDEAARKKALVVAATPSHVMRGVVSDAAVSLESGVLVVSATKGIENDSLQRMSEVFAEVLQPSLGARVAVLTGPSFAREVSGHLPTAVTLAAASEAVAEEARDYFASPHFRVYTSTDVVGAELGGALKNVVAIAAGMADGLGAGHNGRAALITRGMAEILRLGQALGAQPLTLSGLAGMGDLILTCTSQLSRNYNVGLGLGRGLRLEQILGEMQDVAEGVKTARSAYELARREGVEMPIVNEVYGILYEQNSAAEAVAHLMSRESKAEFWT